MLTSLVVKKERSFHFAQAFFIIQSLKDKKNKQIFQIFYALAYILLPMALLSFLCMNRN
jgi:hypothetical protein